MRRPSEFVRATDFENVRRDIGKVRPPVRPTEIEVEPGAAKKHLRPVVLEPLEALLVAFEAIGEWTTDALEAAFEATCKAQGDLKLGKLAQPVRVALGPS